MDSRRAMLATLGGASLGMRAAAAAWRGAGPRREGRPRPTLAAVSRRAAAARRGRARPAAAEGRLDARGRRGDRVFGRDRATVSSTWGSRPGNLLALDLATGDAPAGPTRRERRSASRRPAWRAASSTSATSEGAVHAVGRAQRPARPGPSRRGPRSRPRRWWPTGKVLVGSYDQNLYALDAKTGSQAWTFETEGQVHATAAVDGRRRLRDRLRRPAPRPSASRTGRSCSRSRRAPTPAPPPPSWASRAYYGTFENEVLARGPRRAEGRCGATSPRSGSSPSIRRRRWTRARWSWAAATSSSTPSTPRSGKAALDVRDQGPRGLLARDRGRPSLRRAPATAVSTSSTSPGGTALEEFDAGGPITASPALAAGRLVIGTQDGQVFCLGAKG